MPDEHGRRGAAPADGTAKASLSVHPPNPLVKPLSHPKTRQERENTAPAPRFAGPAPTATTEFPDAFGQYPAGPRSEDDPCHGLRRQPTGGDCSAFINTASVRQGQYPCRRSGSIFLSFRYFRSYRPAAGPDRSSEVRWIEMLGEVSRCFSFRPLCRRWSGANRAGTVPGLRSWSASAAPPAARSGGPGRGRAPPGCAAGGGGPPAGRSW